MPNKDDLSQKLVGNMSAVVSYVCSGMFPLVTIALVFCQLAFFPLFSSSKDMAFHLMLYFAPFVGVAMYMRFRYYLICSACLGGVLCAHAQLMSLDYYELRFKSPLAAVLFTLAGALLIWAVIHGARRLQDARGWGEGSWIKRNVPFVAAILLASLFVSMMPWVVDIMEEGVFTGVLTPVIPDFLAWVCAPAFWLQIVSDALAWFVSFAFVRSLANRVLQGKIRRTLRALFEHWLMVTVVGAFLITMTVSYCLSTTQSLNEAKRSLDSQIDYLITQVKSHVQNQEDIRVYENNLVLSKAKAAANVITHDSEALNNLSNLKGLCSNLGLASLTVCDQTGLVIADSDGMGVGTYNFANNEQTKKYLSILDGTQEYIVEDARESIGENGKGVGDRRVFVGVPRLDQPGFIQASVDTQEIERVMAVASLENLATKYSTSKGGLAIICKGSEIVSSSDDEYKGSNLVEFFGVDPNTDQELRDLIFTGDLVPMQEEGTLGTTFLKVGTFEDYSVFVETPASSVFASRTTTILLNALCSLVLFTFVYLLASNLMDTMVVRSFIRTNRALARITGGDLNQRVEEHDTEEFDSLSDGINTTVDALKNWISEAEARVEQELATAREIQQDALPRTFPPFPEIKTFDIYASMNAAKEVGGDFYDFFPIDDTKIGFLIADVSGKGIPGALFMMKAKTQIENYMSSGIQLAEAIQTANHHLCEGNEAGMFVTVWAAVLDHTTGELTYVNAGHNFPLLRHGNGGEWEWLKKRCGLFLGTFDNAKYRQESIVLREGDELVLYTDGVNEAWNVNEEEFGNDRLEEFLSQHAEEHPRGLVRELRAEVARWATGAEQSDDITILALEYGVAPEAVATIRLLAQIDQLETLLDFVDKELAGRLCPLSAQNKIDMALEELFVNVCRYAYAHDEQPGEVVISYVYNASPNALTIQIDDTGIPFDPLAYNEKSKDSPFDVNDPEGMGIKLTLSSVDDFSYVRDRDHNIVAFVMRW